MVKIKILQFVIVTFLFLNFITLILGYSIFLDFNNSEKAWYNSQIDLSKNKEALIRYNLKNLTLFGDDLELNLLEAEVKLKNLKNQITLNSKPSSTDTAKISALTLELSRLKEEENTLILEKKVLYDQYLREQQRKISQAAASAPVATTSAS